ncbi:PQQ-binding-like beta-propeller repeat protein [candidate division KSB1 bacterium]
MTSRVVLFIFSIILLSACEVSAQIISEEDSKQWPGYRGFFGSGVSLNSETPLSWDIDNSTNIKWKRDIPGLSHSSPIIWDDKLFITAAVSAEKNSELKVGRNIGSEPVLDEPVHEWKLICLNKNTGKTIWEQTANKGVPKQKRHPKSTHANPTPATDGEYVVAFFASEGLYCYDMSGKLVWEKDFGILASGPFDGRPFEWGFASSPIIHNGVVILQCDVKEDSFLAAFDVKNGRELWRTARDDVSAWSTPTIYYYNNIPRIVVNGFKHIGGYDFETGKEVWKLTGGGDIPVPTPIIAHNLIFINNSHGRMSPIYAIKTSAEGDISLNEGELSNNYVVWSIERGASYLPSSIVYGDLFYNCRDNGYLTCYNALTGEQMYRERLGKPGSGFTASPVASNGKLYFTGEKGGVFVVKPGKEFKVLAENSMKDICMATPAISENVLFYRTHHFLIAITENR